MDNGKPLYRSEEYLAYVEDELRLIQDLNTDLIVGDFRHSLGISATLAGKPLINLINAYWSPCRQPAPLPVPELAKLNLHRLPLMPRLMRWITPLAIRLLVAPLNRARAHYGLAPFANCFDAWSHGDQVLYYDAPELVPLSPLPAHHHYLGPVTWSPGGALPDWWPQLQDRPTVYLSLGSSGNLTLLPMLIDQLLGEGLQVIASSGGRQRLPQRPGLFCADFLPGEAAAARRSGDRQRRQPHQLPGAAARHAGDRHPIEYGPAAGDAAYRSLRRRRHAAAQPGRSRPVAVAAAAHAGHAVLPSARRAAGAAFRRLPAARYFSTSVATIRHTIGQASKARYKTGAHNAVSIDPVPHAAIQQAAAPRRSKPS